MLIIKTGERFVTRMYICAFNTHSVHRLSSMITGLKIFLNLQMLKLFLVVNVYAKEVTYAFKYEIFRILGVVLEILCGSLIDSFSRD